MRKWKRRWLRCVVEKAEVFRRSIRRTHRSCASPMLGAICGKLAVIAGFLLFCAVAFAGMGVLGIAFVLIDVDFREFFWLFVPLSVLFALIGAPLGAAGVVYARSAWAVRKR